MPNESFDLAAVQDSLLEAVKQGQEQTIEVLRIVSDLVSPITNRLPKAPFADQLPDPSASLDAGYEFVEKWLAVQRAFAKEVTSVLTPAAVAS